MGSRIKYPYSANIKWEEAKIGKLIDILLGITNEGYNIDLYELNTSTFMPLLKKIDTSTTINYASFIPLNYLREKFKNVVRNKTFENEYNEKKYLLGLINNPDEILNDSYKGIKLNLLKKPLLFAKIIKNLDQSKVIFNDLDINNGNLNPKQYSTLPNYSAWMSDVEINDILNRIVLLNNRKVKKIDVFLIPNGMESSHYVGTELSQLLENVEEDLIILPILYSGHFIILIIDKILESICFFDSRGFDSRSITKASKILHYFIQSDMYTSLYTDNNIKINNNYQYVYVLVKVISKIIKIKNCFFNEYRQQNSSNECGIFVICFALHYLHINPKKVKDVPRVYNAMINKSDFTMTIIRSCFFMTEEDLKNNNIDQLTYEKSLKVYEIKNKHFTKAITDYCNVIETFEEIINNKKISEKLFLFNEYHLLLDNE